VSATRQPSLHQRIAEAVGANEAQVRAAVDLLDGGATVPFISRYRKEITGGLSDSQLRLLEERLGYLREFDARRDTIAASIAEQGKLDDALRARLGAATTKAELEDLYLPYKKKRRTKGQIALEAGLGDLADGLWQDASQVPEEYAARFVDTSRGVDDTKAALDGAQAILMERFAEDASLMGRLRERLGNDGYLCAELVADKAAEGAKFSDYFDHQEPLAKVPGHRALAMFRGRSEGVLSLKVKLREADGFSDQACVDMVASHVGFDDRARAADAWRARVVSWTWKVKLATRLETELFLGLRERADAEAIGVFAANMRDLLLAAPAGARPTLGLDPGFRTGVKVTVVNATGKVVDHTAIFPHQPRNDWKGSLTSLRQLCSKHAVELIAIGNGTASRETERLADALIADMPGQALTKVVVSEAGASVYSASELAEREFPELDVTIRGAISIARRLQDPLAELVKIDPKAIGVGQYQHDVSQTALARSLDATVEDCVNQVGVDLGTASAALLSRVAGLTPTLATNVVAYRDEHGAFKTRKALKKVPRLGEKAFEQAAGFLRIPDGSDPLDASGVHPESYPVVERIVAAAGKPLAGIIGDTAWLHTQNPADFTDERFGEPTVRDILAELEKPGRDPRPEFKTVRFADGVEKIGDLVDDQVLEGQVTNVTAFGAFVDVGVHQDGLVHISALSDTFVKDPRDVVKAGDIVKVKVMSVDVARKRIGLTMRMSDSAANAEGGRGGSARRPEDKRAGGQGTGRASGQGQVNGKAKGGQGGKSGAQRDRNNSGRTAGGRSNGHAGVGNRGSGGEVPSALAESLKAALQGKS
jgi:uncharacterized protein